MPNSFVPMGEDGSGNCLGLVTCASTVVYQRQRKSSIFWDDSFLFTTYSSTYDIRVRYNNLSILASQFRSHTTCKEVFHSKHMMVEIWNSWDQRKFIATYRCVKVRRREKPCSFWLLLPLLALYRNGF